MSIMGKALDYLIIDPIGKKSPALIPLRFAQLLSDRTHGRSDVQIRRMLKPLRSKVSLPPSSKMTGAEIETSVTSLKRRGWDILPFRLDQSTIDDIRKFSFATPTYAEDPKERIPFDDRVVPHAYGRYMWRMDDLIKVPALQNFMRDSALTRIAQDYLDCGPLLTSVTLWADPVFEGKFQPHVYHYDNDGPAFLKFFIYLTDVDMETGAHTYIEKSHGLNKPSQFGRARRYERQELLDHYGQDSEIVFSAPAGTILAEDTSGFHKGTTLKRGYRLMLQLQYAILDIPHEEEYGEKIARIHVPAIDPGIRKISRKFFA